MTEDEERRFVTTPAGSDTRREPQLPPPREAALGDAVFEGVPPDMPVSAESVAPPSEASGFDLREDSRPNEADVLKRNLPIGADATSQAPFEFRSDSTPGTQSVPPTVGSRPVRASNLLPTILGLVTLLLLGAVSYLFYTQPDTGRLAAMDTTLSDLKSRVTAVESRPASSGLDALKQQIEASTQQLAAVKSDISALKDRVASLGSPAQGGTTVGDFGSALTALGAKVADLDQGLDALKAEVAQAKPDLSPITSGIGALQTHFSALQTKVEAIPPVDLAPINARLDTVDGQLKPILAEAQAAKNPDRVTAARENGSAAETRAAPLAVTAQAVQRAIEAGRPFPADLKALQSLGAEAKLVAPLQAVAEAGAPTTQDLRSDLAGVRDRLLAQSAPTPSGSYMDRLMAGAATLVHVRPLGSVVGDAPAAVLARMDDDLAKDDLAAALAEWQKLPEAPRSVAKGLADRIRLRQSAEEAARGIGADAIKAMASAQQ